MRNKKVIILAALGALAVLSLFYGIVTPPGGRRRPPVEQTGVQQGKEVSPSEKRILPLRQGKRTSYSSWGRDPFVLRNTASGAGLMLGGIMWDKENPMAIINGRIVKTGDNVGGNIVVDIRQDSVILNDGGKDVELRITADY